MTRVNRRLSLWWLAAVPATLLGHALVYALTGRTQVDAHHAYAIPAFEYSIAVLLAFCFALLLRALSGRVAGATHPFSWMGTWGKLAVVQVALFTLVERLEGYHVAPVAYAVQVFVALLAALAIACFTRLVHRCERAGLQASSYVRRLLTACDGLDFGRPPYSPAYALTVKAGTARFQRPPPHL